MENDTVFGKIIKGEIPATTVYEDDQCLAFLDINPVNIGHALVIPKEAFKDIFELPPALAGHLFEVAKKIAIGMKEGLGAHGVNIIMNNQQAAGQLVFHAHLHVIPRYEGDGFIHWHGTRGYDGGEASAVAAKLITSIPQ